MAYQTMDVEILYAKLIVQEEESDGRMLFDVCSLGVLFSAISYNIRHINHAQGQIQV